MTPLLRGRVRVPGDPALWLTMLGVDPVSDGLLRDVPLIPQAQDAADRAVSPLERFLADPAAVVVPAPLAERLGVAVGDRVEAQTPAGARTFRVVGLFTPPAGQAAAFSRTLLQDVAAHQALFGKSGTLDELRLRLRPEQERAVAELLPAGLELEPTGRRTERVAQMSRAFRLNLETLGMFALLVALFLILNAATFSVVQRQRVLAVLRCIGADTRTVFLALLAEAVVIGTLGSVVGVLLGRWLGAVMLRNTGATLFDVVLGVEPVPAQAALDLRTWGVGLGLGIGVSLLGALYPAWTGAATSPLGAVRHARGPGPRSFRFRGWLAVGAAALALAGLALVVPGRSLVAGLVAATALALGAAAWCPPMAALLSRVAAWPLGLLLGPTGRLAARNLGRALGRTGLAAASLMIALALALSIEITVRSFKRTLEVWLDQAVVADFYVEPGAPGARALPPGTLAALEAPAEVAAVAVLQSRRVLLAGREVLLLAIDEPVMGARATLPVVDGDAQQAFAGLDAGELLVSETLAYTLGLAAGDTLRLPTPAGAQPLRIAAIIQNYSNPQGVLYLSRARFAALFGSAPPSSAAVWLRPGADAEAVLTALEGQPALQGVRLTPNSALRGDALRVFDRTFAITDLMGTLATFVAFIAVVSALTALLEERIRTLGFLRAIGVSRRALGVSLGLEAGLLALAATVVSWACGLLMAVVLIFVVNRRAFGWTLQFLPGEGSYGRLLLLAVGAAVLGSLYPIWRATRLSITATIREE